MERAVLGLVWELYKEKLIDWWGNTNNGLNRTDSKSQKEKNSKTGLFRSCGLIEIKYDIIQWGLLG